MKRQSSSSILLSTTKTTHYFAVNVKRILTLSALGVEKAEGYYVGLPRRQADFLNCLMNPGDERMTYDLRFISEPDVKLYTRGRIRVAIVARMTGVTAPEAEAAAQHLLRLTSAMFEEYVLELSPPDEVRRLLEPFPVQHLMSLARRSGRERLDTLVSGSRRVRVGFSLTPPSWEESLRIEDTVFHVFPFIPTGSTFNHWLKLLLLHPQPVAVSCRLCPTMLTANEHSFLQEQIAHCERYAQFPLQFDSYAQTEDLGKLRPALNLQARIYQNYQERLLLGLRDNAALMTLEVASPAPIPAMMLDSLGGLVTQPAGGSQPEKQKHEDYHGGGYDVLDLSRHAESLAAFADLGSAIPPHPLAPSAAQRLPHLFDSMQAVAAFRLPPASWEPPLGLEAQTWRFKPAPKELPDEGCLLGVSTHGGVSQPVRITAEDRKRHVYLVGQTGTGKTTLMKTMVLDDMRAGRGLCVIDPHGDLFRELLERVPKERMEDVVILDPTDMQHPAGLNMLECPNESDRHFVVRSMRGIMQRLIGDQYDAEASKYAGPIFYQHMQMNMLLVMSNPENPGTLLEFYEIYKHKYYWKRWLPLQCNDPLLKVWVEKTLPEIDYTRRYADGMTWGEYLGSKFDDFVFDPKLRLIFGQKRSTIDVRSVMRDGKILLVNLAKGELAESNSRFLGMALMAQIMAAAMSRVNLPERDRREFNIYVDEFQSIATESFVTLLSEARKFGVSLVLANQFIAQVRDRHPEIVNAILGNVGTSVCFRLGLADAELMEREFFPTFNRFDLSNLPNWRAYASTLVHNQTLPPFSLETVLPDVKPDPAIAEAARAHSRKQFARTRAKVEAELAESLKSFPIPPSYPLSN